MSLVPERAFLRAFSVLTLTVLVLVGGLLSYAMAAPGGKPGKSAVAETCGESLHPSGKDRCVEKGGSGTQGRSQSDPDADSNGGLDKPDGDGGINTADQDGNNGCGNDQDFEDDNNGWCGRKPHPNKPETPEGGTPGGPAAGDDGSGDDVTGGDTSTGDGDTSVDDGDSSTGDGDTSTDDGATTGDGGAGDSGSGDGSQTPPAPSDTPTGDDIDLTVGGRELETAESDQVLGSTLTSNELATGPGATIGGGDGVLGAGGAVTPVGATADAALAATGATVWVLLGAALAALSIGVLAVRRSAAGTPQR